jgi:tRNA (mo5U34)-methyltransferase
MNKDELQQRIAAFPYWYHRIELTDGVTTPGWAPISADAYRIPDDLSGKRVLDVGAWDGFWTFEAMKRGAAQVIAIDDFSDFVGEIEVEDRKAWETFDLCREALGYDHDSCQRHEMTIYDLTPETFGMFDVVFCFGVLYHLRWPMYAIDKLSDVYTGDLFMESAVSDDFSAYRGGLGKGFGSDMVAEFYPNDEYGENETNWWAPTLRCMGSMVKASGFETVRGWKLTDKPQRISQCRGFVWGTKDQTKG